MNITFSFFTYLVIDKLYIHQVTFRYEYIYIELKLLSSVQSPLPVEYMWAHPFRFLVPHNPVSHTSLPTTCIIDDLLSLFSAHFFSSSQFPNKIHFWILGLNKSLNVYYLLLVYWIYQLFYICKFALFYFLFYFLCYFQESKYYSLNMGNENPFCGANGSQEGSNYDEIFMQHSLQFSDSLKVWTFISPLKYAVKSLYNHANR